MKPVSTGKISQSQEWWVPRI